MSPFLAVTVIRRGYYGCYGCIRRSCNNCYGCGSRNSCGHLQSQQLASSLDRYELISSPFDSSAAYPNGCVGRRLSHADGGSCYGRGGSVTA